MDFGAAADLLTDKSALGTTAGLVGGTAVLGSLLKAWGASEASAAAKRKLLIRKIHPGAAAGAGALLALLGKHAYDKYKESQYETY